MKKTLSFIIAALLFAMLMIPAAAAQLETAIEGQPVTVADIEWQFIPAGDGAYHLQSIATGEFLRVSGDTLAMGADPHAWIYGEHDESGDPTMWAPAQDAPLRYSPNMRRWSARRAFTYIGIFEKQEEGRYTRVSAVTDNAVYIIMGMNSDDGDPRALSNFLETNDGNNMGGVFVPISGNEINFNPPPPAEEEPAPVAEPEPIVQDVIDPVSETEPASDGNIAEETGATQPGESNIILFVIIGLAVVVVIIIIVLIATKNKK